jgi:hypothetical protein
MNVTEYLTAKGFLQTLILSILFLALYNFNLNFSEINKRLARLEVSDQDQDTVIDDPEYPDIEDADYPEQEVYLEDPESDSEITEEEIQELIKEQPKPKRTRKKKVPTEVESETVVEES